MRDSIARDLAGAIDEPPHRNAAFETRFVRRAMKQE
jgi:hypothetical protein